MQMQQVTSVGIVASVVFGAVIAILAVLGADAVGLVAAIGGIALGVMWVVIGVIRRGRTTT